MQVHIPTTSYALGFTNFAEGVAVNYCVGVSYEKTLVGWALAKSFSSHNTGIPSEQGEHQYKEVVRVHRTLYSGQPGEVQIHEKD